LDDSIQVERALTGVLQPGKSAKVHVVRFRVASKPKHIQKGQVLPPTDPAFFALLAGSFTRLVGHSLVPAENMSAEPAAWLYAQAPFCVLAHDTQADPRFIYANEAAQECFGYAWDELVGLPSRLSAEPVHREERQHLLDQVSKQGYASNYAGIRISKTGHRFWIEDGTVWQLMDEQGVIHGQAAMFTRWREA